MNSYVMMNTVSRKDKFVMALSIVVIQQMKKIVQMSIEKNVLALNLNAIMDYVLMQMNVVTDILIVLMILMNKIVKAVNRELFSKKRLQKQIFMNCLKLIKFL